MTVSSVWFPGRMIHKIILSSPDGPTFNQIDYVLIGKYAAFYIFDVRSYRDANCYSDYYLIGERYRYQLANNGSIGLTPIIRSDIE